jgi:hypothetical protein
MATTKGRNDVCDAWRHRMVEVPDDRRYSELKVWKFQIVLRCERCPVRRYLGLDANGDIGMSRYAYPDDWKRYPAEEKPSTSEFRRRYAARRNRSLS